MIIVPKFITWTRKILPDTEEYDNILWLEEGRNKINNKLLFNLYYKRDTFEIVLEDIQRDFKYIFPTTTTDIKPKAYALALRILSIN